MIFSRLWHRVLGKLEAGELPAWMRESREQVAREHLTREVRALPPDPLDRARRFVMDLGPGADGEYALAYCCYLTGPGCAVPPLPRGLTPWRAQQIRIVLDAYVVEHRWRA